MKRSEVQVPFESLTAPERETIIRTSDADNYWEVYTARPATYRELVAKGYKPVETDEFGAWFRLPHITIPTKRSRRGSRSGNRTFFGPQRSNSKSETPKA